jgi:uncharacterized membrane protein YhiD involved in acid resistance
VTRADTLFRVLVVTGLLVLAGSDLVLARQDPFSTPPPAPASNGNGMSDLWDALIRLPFACALGAMLALRPKRRGTPTRTPAVVQTQIILAVVGAVIMLVVGSSLARAFGIVGAANLIRYRAKVDDPKDAGVMLCTLAVGLAAGVGLLPLAAFSAVFILVALWVIESFEPSAKKDFELAVGVAENANELRARVEAVLERLELKYELRTTSADKLVYAVKLPYDVETETVTNAILRLDPKNAPTVEWEEKKTKGK